MLIKGPCRAPLPVGTRKPRQCSAQLSTSNADAPTTGDEQEVTRPKFAFRSSRIGQPLFRSPGLAGSAFCDQNGFTRNLEQAYREMWHVWCARQQAEKPIVP